MMGAEAALAKEDPYADLLPDSYEQQPPPQQQQHVQAAPGYAPSMFNMAPDVPLSAGWCK